MVHFLMIITLKYIKNRNIMITLKCKIVKKEITDLMRIKAEEIYKNAWEKEMNIESFMLGVQTVLSNLQVKIDK